MINDRSIVTELIALRTVNGLTQQQVADRLGCTQSWFAKFESRKDADIRLGDLFAYMHAIGMDGITLEIGRLEP